MPIKFQEVAATVNNTSVADLLTINHIISN